MAINECKVETDQAQSGAPGELRFPQSLAPLYELNCQTLKLLAAVQDHRSPLKDCAWLELAQRLTPLQAPLIESLSRCPFLLLDCGFEHPKRWLLNPPPSATNDLLDDELAQVTQAACWFAWHLVRNDPIAAQLMLGVGAASTKALLQLHLTDIRDVSLSLVHTKAVKPRWHDRPDVWHRLILMTQSARRAPFTSVSVRGLQLFLGELLLVDDAGT